MAITSGLNVRLLVEGRDLSGDANALDSMGYTQNLLDTTTLNKAAMARITGLSTGSVSVSAYFDNASTQGHATFSQNSGKLPTADQVVLVPLGSDIGSPSVGLSGKQAEYNVSRTSGSAITSSVTYEGNGMGGEFGVMLTAFDDTHASSSSNSSVDNSASSSGGGVGYLENISLGSGTVTVKIEDSPDDATWSDLLTFTATGTSDVPSAERVEVTGTVDRYVRVTTTGTFTNLKFACQLVRL